VVEEYDEIDDEETSFGPKSYKDIQKKKPAAPPSRPTIGKDGKQLTEAQKEEERKKKLKAMEEAKRKEEEKKMRKDVGKDKDIATLETENKGEMVEVDETRQPCSLVFIGHVDAGKSTISGNLMYAMGVVDKRTIDKYKEEAKSKNRESWWLAYVMDENEEEKAKGKTVEIGRANFDT
jgi:peptide chain release factor subunit 3